MPATVERRADARGARGLMIAPISLLSSPEVLVVHRRLSWLWATSRQSVVLFCACGALATTAAVVGAGYAYAIGVGLATARAGAAS